MDGVIGVAGETAPGAVCAGFAEGPVATGATTKRPTRTAPVGKSLGAAAAPAAQVPALGRPFSAVGEACTEPKLMLFPPGAGCQGPVAGPMLLPPAAAAAAAADMSLAACGRVLRPGGAATCGPAG